MFFWQQSSWHSAIGGKKGSNSVARHLRHGLEEKAEAPFWTIPIWSGTTTFRNWLSRVISGVPSREKNFSLRNAASRRSVAIIDTPFLNVFIIALKAWKEDPAEAQVVLGENQEMLTFADANEAHRWAQAHLTVGKWAILKVKLRLTR